MLHVVSFSSGLSSALAALVVVDRYGAENTMLVFCDTCYEDEDNYRFMQDFSNRFGIEIFMLKDGRNPYQVAEDQHVIPNQKVAPCTLQLKIKQFQGFLQSLYHPITVHLGFDYLELHRCEAARRNYEALGYGVDFPLLWKPYELRKYSTVARLDWSIEPPRMYDLGYTHANCGGRCCKQGWGDWLRTLLNWPARYAEVEAWEERMRTNPVNANYALMRNQAGGKVQPLTLKEFRELYEARRINQSLLQLDQASSCVVCGVGG